MHPGHELRPHGGIVDDLQEVLREARQIPQVHTNSAQAAREILELIHSPYMSKDHKQTSYKEDDLDRETTISKFDGNIEEAQQQDEEEQELESVGTTVTLVGPAGIVEEVAEEEHTFIIKQSEEEDEFHSVDLELDIDNEIIINEEEAHEVEEVAHEIEEVAHEIEEEDLLPHDKQEAQEEDFLRKIP